MNEREYFEERVRPYVVEKIPHEHGRLMREAEKIEPKMGDRFGLLSTYSFLLQLRQGFGVKLHEGPVAERMAVVLRHFGAKKEDDIVTASEEYFGERFQFEGPENDRRKI